MNRSGFARIIILIVVVGILIIGGVLYYETQRQPAASPTVVHPQTSTSSSTGAQTANNQSTITPLVGSSTASTSPSSTKGLGTSANEQTASAGKSDFFGTMVAYNASGNMLPLQILNELQEGWSVLKNDSQESAGYLNFLQQYYNNQDKLVEETNFSSDRELDGFFTWNVIELEKGIFDWTLTDLAAQHAKATGIKFSAVIQPYATWDQTNTSVIAGCNMLGSAYFDYKAGPPNDWTEYRNFLEVTVERYQGVVSDWEIANEPDASCSGYQNNPEGYLKLLQTSYGIIKGVYPKAKVLNGGASGFSTNSEERSFWTTFFQLGGGNYLDAFNLHYNAGKNGVASDPSNFLDDLNFYNNLIAGQSLKKPIWLTEFGTYSGTPQPPPGSAQNGQTPAYPTQSQELQAAWHFRYSVIAFANNVGRIFIDFIGMDNSNVGGSAIYNNQGQSRLFLKTLQAIDAEIGGFNNVEKISDGQYKFIVSDKTIYALWAGTLPSEITGQVKMTDITGKKQLIDATSIKLNADQPVFIELLIY